MKALKRFCLLVGGVLIFLVPGGGGVAEVEALSNTASKSKGYTFSWWFGGMEVDRRDLEEFGARQTSSKYFDKAMQYNGTRFKAFPLEKLFENIPRNEMNGADSLLLNCFDDYQGLISIDDIKHYRLELATQIHLPHGIRPPSWLKPLMILVPDGVDAPFHERFLTANIKGMILVKLTDYYAPLDRVAVDHPETLSGLQNFKDNCVYCHSLKGVGGNKGGSLLEKFDLSKKAERDKFKKRFLGFHNIDNADKQNVEQFVNEKGLSEIAGFLQKIGP